MIKLYINDTEVSVSAGSTLLQAAQAAGVEVPTLCYLKDLTPGGACRMCQVTVEGQGLKTACNTPAAEGMRVYTHSPQALAARKSILEFLLSRHLHSCFNCDRHPSCHNTLFPYCNFESNCFTCGKRDSCKLRKYSLEAGIIVPALPNLCREQPDQADNPVLVQDPNRCVLCRRCVATCAKVKAPGYISIENRGAESVIRFPAGEAAHVCIGCGKCAENCPTGALQLK